MDAPGSSGWVRGAAVWGLYPGMLSLPWTSGQRWLGWRDKGKPNGRCKSGFVQLVTESKREEGICGC